MAGLGRILVAEDGKTAAKALERLLVGMGYDVTSAATLQAALSEIAASAYDVVVAAERLGRLEGLRILKACRDSAPITEVVVVSSTPSVEAAVEAMRQGAFGYLAKPLRPSEIDRLIGEAMSRVHRRRLVTAFSRNETIPDDFLTRTPSVERVLGTAKQVARLDCPVLIVGQQGTGRRALARTLHRLGSQSGAPFVMLKCSAIDAKTLEARLFGKDAPTKGTLLLEEVERLPAPLQARLVLALELPSGSEGAMMARILASTTDDLDAAVDRGAFRQDLLMLLRVVTLALPPLAKRALDIPLLALHFLNKQARDMNKPGLRISDDALALLSAYDYPGNVRELDTIIKGAAAVCDGTTIETGHLPDFIGRQRGLPEGGGQLTLAQHERDYVLKVLDDVGGNQTQAAARLGIDRATLWRKLKRYEGAV